MSTIEQPRKAISIPWVDLLNDIGCTFPVFAASLQVPDLAKFPTGHPGDCPATDRFQGEKEGKNSLTASNRKHKSRSGMNTTAANANRSGLRGRGLRLERQGSWVPQKGVKVWGRRLRHLASAVSFSSSCWASSLTSKHWLRTPCGVVRWEMGVVRSPLNFQHPRCFRGDGKCAPGTQHSYPNFKGAHEGF